MHGSHLLIAYRDAKDPKGMTEQILAIAPILPGQKVNSDFEIPPRAPNTTTHLEKTPQQNQGTPAPASGGGNDLIDFGAQAPNATAVAANQNVPSQHRTRSVSLMDDDRHINAMNNQMGKMKLMAPTQTPATTSTGNGKPLERTDTQTSEVDAFFDAEG